MVDKQDQAQASVPVFRSGVAARMTGVPVETLRVWERRYGVVGPRLSDSGQRLYSAEQVHRLGMIKQLVDTGHPIGSIASLSAQALMGMCADRMPLARPNADIPLAPAMVTTLAQHIGVALVGSWLTSPAISNALLNTTLRCTGSCAELQDAPVFLAGKRVDIVIIELPMWTTSPLQAIETARKVCAATHVIVFYRFAPASLLQQLRMAGYEVVRQPHDASEIEWFCRAVMRPSTVETALDKEALQQVPVFDAQSASSSVLASPKQAPPPPKFDEASLAGIAGIISGLYCECPRHVAQLLLNLNSFEKYSAQCANRDVKDAQVHRELQWASGHARALLENALVSLAEAEGITLAVNRSET